MLYVVGTKDVVNVIIDIDLGVIAELKVTLLDFLSVCNRLQHLPLSILNGLIIQIG